MSQYDVLAPFFRLLLWNHFFIDVKTIQSPSDPIRANRMFLRTFLFLLLILNLCHTL